MVTDYEEIKNAVKDWKIENDGIWLSWDDLWKIYDVATRNALKSMDENEFKEMGLMMFYSFIGQRVLIEDIAELVRPKKEEWNGLK